MARRFPPMPPLLQSLTSASAIIGPVVTLIGLIQSRGWLAGIGAALACAAIIAFIYARSQRRRVTAATVEIEGISIDSLNAANLRRRVSSRFMIQTVKHVVTIDGPDLTVEWRYAGYCRAAEATAFEFSVDCETSIPFPSLECSGYDLKADPERQHRIPPVLIGPDGISKKVAVPFVQPLAAQHPFDVMLTCRLPGIFKPTGKTYYTSSLSFAQATIAQCTVELNFRGQAPEWLRVYECLTDGDPRLLRTLTPIQQALGQTQYVDVAENRAAQSARIYLFRRKDVPLP